MINRIWNTTPNLKIRFYSFRTPACSSFIILLSNRTSHAQRTKLCSTHSFNTWWRSWENQRRGCRRWRSGWRRCTPCWLWCPGALVKAAGSWRRCSRCCGQPDTAPWKRRGSWARCFALGATLSLLLTAPLLWDFRGIICWGMHPKYKVVWACKNKPLSLYSHDQSMLSIMWCWPLCWNHQDLPSDTTKHFDMWFKTDSFNCGSVPPPASVGFSCQFIFFLVCWGNATVI